MKTNWSRLFFLVAFCFMVSTSYSCSKKIGCPINDKAQTKTDKKGNFKKSKAKSGLFPKR